MDGNSHTETRPTEEMVEQVSKLKNDRLSKAA